MNESKLPKLNNEDKEDRISVLPDSVLSHIISFLPTRVAVQTCILSSRWKLVWTSYPNLHFDDTMCYFHDTIHNFDDTLLPCSLGSDDATDAFLNRVGRFRANDATDNALTRFENFIDRLLLSSSLNINKFSLRCWDLRGLPRLNSWVSYAIKRNVREIEINLLLQDGYGLPESIYTSKTLEVLKLYSGFEIKIPPTGVCFSNVKILHVKIFHPDNNITERLCSLCPVLEDLSLVGYLHDHDRETIFNISSPVLKKLTIRLEQGFSDYGHKVIIRAPNLVRLSIEDDDLVDYTFHELNSLTEVIFDFCHTQEPGISNHHVFQVLNAVTKAKFLSLSGCTLSAINYNYDNYFPAFPYLAHLEVNYEELGWRMLPIILNSSPNLETFVFEKDIDLDVPIEEIGTLWQCVPQCLLLKVKKIEMREFAGRKGELELVKYLLKNGEVLKVMSIRFHKRAPKEKLCEKILFFHYFHRGSKACQLEL